MDASTSNQERWFAEQVQPHEPALRAYLRRSFPSLFDVDDLVQETTTARASRSTARRSRRAASGGSFRADEPEDFVRLLQSRFGLRVERRGDETILGAER